jgi:hypothetical protein
MITASGNSHHWQAFMIAASGNFETFGHVINVLILSIRLDTVFWYSLSRCMCELDPGAHVFYAFRFALKSGCDKVVPEPC